MPICDYFYRILQAAQPLTFTVRWQFTTIGWMVLLLSLPGI